MNIIVIGGEGFVGKYLCQMLSQRNIPFVSVDKHPCQYQIDITNLEQLNTLPMNEDDIVVHLATRQYANKPPKHNRQAYFDAVNVDGLQNVFNRMQETGCHQMIYFSSDMIYGLPKYTPLNIDHPKSPIGEYGESKKKAETMCQVYRKQGVAITIFRPRLIVGPGRLGILKKLFKRIMQNKAIPLIGDGNNYYQMVSVFDCVSAIIKAIEHHCPNDAFNLGSKELITTYDLLSGLIHSVGSTSQLIRTNAALVKLAIRTLSLFSIELMYPEQYALADQKYYVDIEHTEKVLGWQPQYTDKDMLTQAYQRFKDEQQCGSR